MQRVFLPTFSKIGELVRNQLKKVDELNDLKTIKVGSQQRP